MKNLLSIIAVYIVSFVFSQTKNFIDQPYLETSAKADTLVIPDRIYLDILISEKDTKDKKSIEELEILMEEKLKSIGIDTKKQYITFTLHTGEDFHLVEKYLATWQSGEDPLA